MGWLPWQLHLLHYVSTYVVQSRITSLPFVCIVSKEVELKWSTTTPTLLPTLPGGYVQRAIALRVEVGGACEYKEGGSLISCCRHVPARISKKQFASPGQ